MKTRTLETSPQVYAHIAALSYLVVIPAEIIAQMVIGGRIIFPAANIGSLVHAGGLGWLTFLYPPPGNQLFMIILLIGLIGSVSLILWLLARGVNVENGTKRVACKAPPRNSIEVVSTR